LEVVMAKTETGGPAYPVQTSEVWATGVTVRDYFAGKALEAFLSKSGLGTHEAFPDIVAHASYLYADAMLKERAK
jgi:hypothetical protein